MCMSPLLLPPNKKLFSKLFLLPCYSPRSPALLVYGGVSVAKSRPSRAVTSKHTVHLYQRYRIELVLLFSITLYIDNPIYIYIYIS